uniref:Kinesin-like protein KIF6-like n=1 Tax=Saccoglossus kowalevskii TaxID=10224 RepID=A0ABM0LZ00_SACKO|nr:PREDICTED: kinesin-like protein KIF6-like [Saccoglossus kowalevskii]
MAHIKTYCRIRPTPSLSQCFDWDSTKFYFRTPEQQGRNVERGKTIDYEFQFGSTFGPHTSQDEVFHTVAKDIVTGFLSGYNGTIFAYGQTGSGKTFTVEGGARRYSDRGLSPRALSMIYRALQSRTDEDISVHVSYLEIYQETGYDLLNPSTRQGNVVTHLPKVSVVEGPQNTCIVRNLSHHLAADEHIAQALLLQGQANRKVAETPMNQRSSRSHAVFTIHLTARSPESEVITRSKLAKTGIWGQQLDEAKFINLSLHYLESVIIALQDQIKKTETRHIPYRNSLLTMVLRDSLGGNCLTAMIATVSIEESNIGETMSTCRFAQRVACIQNHASRNEELDDKMVIKKLRRRIAELEAEIACLKSSQYANQDNYEVHLSNTEVENAEKSEKIPRTIGLSDDDKKLCRRIMHGFISGQIKDPVAAGIKDPYKFKECTQILRTMLITSYAQDDSTELKDESISLENDRGRTVHRTRTKTGSYGDQESSTQERMQDKSGDTMPMPRPRRAQSAPVTTNRRARRSRQLDHQKGVEEAHQTLSPRGSMSDHGAKRNTYKSPFEEKRDRDIRRIGAKVDRLKETQVSDRQDLLEFQISIKEEQLELMKADIKQGKYERRLRFVREQLQIIEEQQRQQNFGEAEQEKKQAESENDRQTTSFKEELLRKYQMRDGKVNSRKVLEVLRKEERKQDKMQATIEHQRIQSVTNHLAIKEAKTRQKLAEFKDKLKQSKEERQIRPSSHPSSSGSDGLWAHSSEVVTEDWHAQQDSNIMSPSNTSTPERSGWMSSTPSSAKKESQFSPNTGTSEYTHTGSELSHSPITSASHTNTTRRTLSMQYADKGGDTEQEMSLFTTPSQQRTSFTNTTNVTKPKNVPQNITVEDIEDSYPQSTPVTSANEHKEKTPKKSPFDNTFAYTPAKVPNMMVSAQKKQVYNSGDLPKDNKPNESKDSEMTYTPSDYVQNENKFTFDPHKFSLQSRTFDSALHSMLDDSSSRPLSPPSNKDYDWFSSSKWSNYSSGYGDSAIQSGVSSPIGTRVQSAQIWANNKSPDENPLSMKEKLARYLDKSSTTAANKKSPPKMMMVRRSEPCVVSGAGEDISTLASSLKLANPTMDSFESDPFSMYTTACLYSDGHTQQENESESPPNLKLDNDRKTRGSDQKCKDIASMELAKKKPTKPKINAMVESEREKSYVNSVKQQKERRPLLAILKDWLQ